jgi:hypothetical protein
VVRVAGSAGAAQVAKQARKTLAAANSATAALASRRAYLLDLLAASPGVASLSKRVFSARADASPNAAYVDKCLATSRSAASAQVGDVTKSAIKTWSAANGAAASFVVSGRTIVLRGSSVQVATVGRVVSVVRIGLSPNVGIKRVTLPRAFVASSDNLGSLALVTIPLSFKLTRSALHAGGGDEGGSSRAGYTITLRVAGASQRLTSGGRSGTLTTTGD